MDANEMSSNIALGPRFTLQAVTTEYVERQLSQLNHQQGYWTRQNQCTLTPGFSKNSRSSFTTYCEPLIQEWPNSSTWKYAQVTALFKQGDRIDKDNYRPIFILPTVSKVIERAVHSQLYDFLDINKLLSVN